MPVRLDLPERPPLVSRRDLAELGADVRARIIERTRRGVGADGRRFAPREDGSPSRLSDSGRLLSSIEVEATDTGVRVSTRVPYAEHVHARRPFLGLTRAEAAEVERELSELIARRAGAEGGR